MRRATALLPLLALAACQTPREACLSDAARPGRVIESLIAETSGNLARGYTIEEDQEVRVDRDTCRVRLDDGSVGRVRCDETRVIDVSRPVAIDLVAERAQLDSLLGQRALLDAERDARARGCIQAYPAG